jgi:release factor glutamine methyltransferase
MKKMPQTLSEIIKQYRLTLSGIYPDGEILQFINYLAEAYLHWDPITVHNNYNKELHIEVPEKFIGALNRLASGEPIQYIIGYAWFEERKFKVNRDVLIPRPETEQLCQLIGAENAGRSFQDFSILDIGTGSGCIAITLKHIFPHASVTGLDKMTGALKVAEENAHMLNTEVKLVQHDILDETHWPALGKFDVMVSNPPYVLNNEKVLMHRNVLDYEPPEALFVPDTDPLLFYKSIATFARRKLIRPGILYLEINEKLGQQVKQLLIREGFEKCKIFKDFHDRERFVVAEARTEMRDQSYWYEEHR